MHSFRVGGGSCLSAGGTTNGAVPRQDRWKLDANKDYIRSHGVDARDVSAMLANVGIQEALRQGQKAVWGRDRAIDLHGPPYK